MHAPDSRAFADSFAAGLELQRAGRLEEAIRRYEAAIALNAAVPDVHNNLGCALMALRRYDEAAAAFERALALRSDYVTALDNLGLVRTLREQHAEAVVAHARAAQLEPGNALVHLHLGNALVSVHRDVEAQHAFEDAIRLSPRDAAAYNGLGAALDRLRRNEEAEAAFRTALDLDPNHGEAACNLGCVLLNGGDVAGAADWFDRALAIEPQNPRFHFNRGLVRTGPADPAQLAALERSAQTAHSVAQRIYLHFALATAYEAAGRYDEAFAQLLAGNALKRTTIAYDEAETLRSASVLTNAYNEPFLAALRGSGNPSTRPIFVFGMPRSGTTLVESILAAQSGIAAGGELRVFGQLAQELGMTIATGLSLWELSRSIRTLADRYLQMTDALASAEHLIDKMPGNVWYAPLIHLAFPNAKMIHVRRDRLDTCVSCFATLFVEQGVPYAYDLGELGRHYRAYETAVARWRALVPPDRFIEVEYERLVDDAAGEARRLVAFCERPWDADAPAFHAVRRMVRTASAAQVRRPLYRTAVGRFARYATHLGPLVEALGEPVA